MNSVCTPRPALIAVALSAVTASVLVSTATPASATTTKQKALSVAAAQKGDPYQYGATGPNRFDCSGLTQYAYKHAGRSIPRVAQAQYNVGHHISWKSRQKGDLVAIGTRPGNIFHIGLYAGYWSGRSWYWHAPKTGQNVKLASIKSSLYSGVHAYYAEAR